MYESAFHKRIIPAYQSSHFEIYLAEAFVYCSRVRSSPIADTTETRDLACKNHLFICVRNRKCNTI